MAGKKSDAKSGTKGGRSKKDDGKRAGRDSHRDVRERPRKDAEKKGSGGKASGPKTSGPGRPSPAATAPDVRPSDLIEALQGALRSTDARLAEAERRLQQLQQRFDDERLALADTADGIGEEALLDAAVAVTVEEAVRGAEESIEGAGALDDLVAEAEVLEVAASVLDEVAGEVGGAESAEDDGVDAETRGARAAPDDGPDESWTLVRLRQEARHRGLTGTSTLAKEALLARLTA